MITQIVKKIFGSRNERVLRQMGKVVSQINQLESSFKALADSQLQAKTAQFRTRYQQGETLDSLLPEAFAAVREAGIRTLEMRHFDVQLMGGIVLHQGKIAEMRTGEGKTLAATLAVFLNTIPSQGVHVVTVNEYLAKRDTQWMRPIYEFLGLTVGVIAGQMTLSQKKQAYQCDITYGTNNEFGFDYLRDNMAFNLESKVQRGHAYAIVDEVDSILIDEARTPLIISGTAKDSSQLYLQINKLMPQLIRQKEENGPGDYAVDEKQHQAYLTEAGHQQVEKLLAQAGLLTEGDSLYSPANITLMHYLNAALRAYTLYQKDVDYIVRDNQVIIVDEHTGRTMLGRRWSEGLHQAVEAKEGVTIQSENQTLASITFQNYFRLHDKLAGMTGTADTEAYEFQQIYNLEVVVIPTNQLMIREDFQDLFFISQQDKFTAIIKEVKECVSREQPVLVGTASIEASEILSRFMKQANIVHQVLNAKFHEKEAMIIAEAGRPGVVTIATNMAGRGTDIVLGGSLEAQLQKLDEDTTPEQKQAAKAQWERRNQQVIKAGGLRIIGSERHESRRNDNQLRGRAGRQGDPGSSQFYLSLEDNLIRIFASERFGNLMKKGIEPGEAIQLPFLTRAIENAQRKVESRNFDIRKQLLEYDDVANDQRKVIYQQRAEIMAQDDLSDLVTDLRNSVVTKMIDTFVAPESLVEQWDINGLEHQLANDFTLKLPVNHWLDSDPDLNEAGMRARILAHLTDAYQAKVATIEPAILEEFEKSIILRALDNQWREHLAGMDHLRQGIHLRGYAQKDPKQEYKREAFALFSAMLDSVKHEIISILSSVQVQGQADVEAMEKQRSQSASEIAKLEHETVSAMAPATPASAQPVGAKKVRPYVRHEKKVGRNEPCPCGSGKKFKQCHGSLQ